MHIRFAAPALGLALVALGCGKGLVTTQPPDSGNPDAGSDAGVDGGAGDGGSAEVCATDPLPAQVGPAVVTAGAADRILVHGRIVTPDTVIDPGDVLISGGRITCVAADCSTFNGALGATRIDTKGVVFPGLVDAHNHTQYDYLPPWTPNPPKLFNNRGEWPQLADYKAWVQSVNANEGTSVCEQVKWGELRALVGGSTTIQGTFNSNRTCFRTLVHNAEYGNELGPDTTRTNIQGVDSITASDGATLRTLMLNGMITAYVLHLAEGVDDKSRGELARLETRGMLLPQMVLIHATALGPPELRRVAAAHAKIIWSPLSNLVLYGATTDVPTALSLGISVSLAPDWSLSGSSNLLGELKVARDYSCKNWNGLLDGKQLVQMSTSTPADALALTTSVGRLAPGLLADLLVIADRGADPYRTLVEAGPADVRLVMVQGNLRFGDAELMAAAGRTNCESLDMCSSQKTICVADVSSVPSDKLDESLLQIKNVLTGFYPAGPYRLDVCP